MDVGYVLNLVTMVRNPANRLIQEDASSNVSYTPIPSVCGEGKGVVDGQDLWKPGN